MPKRLKNLRPVLSCSPVQSRLIADWRKKWLPQWEREHGPATITQAEAEYLIWGAVDHAQWAEPCVDCPREYVPYPDVPAAGWRAPVGVRHFAAFFARSPDECLHFMTWCRRYANYVGESKQLHVEMIAQAVNVESLVGLCEFSHKEIAVRAEKGMKGVSVDNAEDAVANLRRRFPGKRKG